MVSNLFDLNIREVFKGFMTAFFGALVLALKAIFVSGGLLPVTWTDWSSILYTGIGAGLLYISITFFTGPVAANAEKVKEPEQ
jgi:hypothetical protein